MTRIVSIFWLALLVVETGCTRVGKGGSQGPSTSVTKKDPWPLASAEVARQPDTVAARRALTQLNTDLESQNQSLPVLSTDEVNALAKTLPPSADEAKDWAARSFTPMDSVYLGECLFFHTVARSLDVADQPDDVRAKAGFDWVCRQMYLRPWLLPAPMPPVPPQDALRRGYGTGLERAYAFLALARQLKLNAMLVGGPGAEPKRAWDPTPNAPQSRGPFWAVGVQAGDDVLLFDPWIGEAIPGTDGKKIATLSEAKANLALVTTWLESKKNTHPVKNEDIFNAVSYLSVPFSAYTPRMKELEKKFEGEVTGIRLAANTADLAARTAKLPGGPAKWHAPPPQVDPFAPLHALGAFTPKDDGGFDATPAGPQQLASLHALFSPLSPNLFELPAELKSQPARQALLGFCEQQYRLRVVEPGFRDRLQRGQTAEVVRLLVELDRDYGKARDRFRSDAEMQKNLPAWYDYANATYERARQAILPENAAMRPEVDAAVKALWSNASPGPVLAIGIVAKAGTHEVAYLLAVCKHEEAERSQIKAVKNPALAPKAAGDWAVARDAWARYLHAASDFDAAHPGRREHAEKLAAKAQSLAH